MNFELPVGNMKPLSNEQKLDRDLQLLFCHWCLKLGTGKISCM